MDLPGAPDGLPAAPTRSTPPNNARRNIPLPHQPPARCAKRPPPSTDPVGAPHARSADRPLKKRNRKRWDGHGLSRMGLGSGGRRGPRHHRPTLPSVQVDAALRLGRSEARAAPSLRAVRSPEKTPTGPRGGWAPRTHPSEVRPDHIGPREGVTGTTIPLPPLQRNDHPA